MHTGGVGGGGAEPQRQNVCENQCKTLYKPQRHTKLYSIHVTNVIYIYIYGNNVDTRLQPSLCMAVSLQLTFSQLGAVCASSPFPIARWSCLPLPVASSGASACVSGHTNCVWPCVCVEGGVEGGVGGDWFACRASLPVHVQ